MGQTFTLDLIITFRTGKEMEMLCRMIGNTCTCSKPGKPFKMTNCFHSIRIFPQTRRPRDTSGLSESLYAKRVQPYLLKEYDKTTELDTQFNKINHILNIKFL
jgi:hypothetical protein